MTALLTPFPLDGGRAGDGGAPTAIGGKGLGGASLVPSFARSGRTPTPDPSPIEGEGSLPIEGYASLFWTRDLADDVVAAGAFAESLGLSPGPLTMLHAHDARAPVGVWDEAREDARGLYVKGRILTGTPGGRLAGALVRAGALDGLSIGFRTRRARRDGRLRVLSAVDLQEVSLVSFPMLPGARLTRG